MKRRITRRVKKNIELQANADHIAQLSRFRTYISKDLGISSKNKKYYSKRELGVKKATAKSFPVKE